MDSLIIKYCWTVFELVSSTLAHNPLEHLVAPNRVLLVEGESELGVGGDDLEDVCVVPGQVPDEGF